MPREPLFSKEDKRKAVSMLGKCCKCCGHYYSLQYIADRWGVTKATICRWRKQFEEEEQLKGN